MLVTLVQTPLVMFPVYFSLTLYQNKQQTCLPKDNLIRQMIKCTESHTGSN